MTTRKRNDAETMFGTAVRVKRAADDAGWLRGYAATFLDEDRAGETFAPGAFSKSIAAQPNVPLLWQHDSSAPCGRIVSMREDRTGLVIEARLNLGTETGAMAYEHIKGGSVDSLSVGYIVRRREGDRLLEVDLAEISLVSVPANIRAKLTAVKSLDSKRALRAVLHQGGWPRSKAEKAADAAWLIKADGADEDEPPYCHYCGDDTGERGPLLKGLDADLCVSCAQEAAVLAQKQTHVVIEKIDAAILEIKSLGGYRYER